jgi:hypothetical protein
MAPAACAGTQPHRHQEQRYGELLSTEVHQGRRDAISSQRCQEGSLSQAMRDITEGGVAVTSDRLVEAPWKRRTRTMPAFCQPTDHATLRIMADDTPVFR